MKMIFALAVALLVADHTQAGEEIATTDWMPPGPFSLGITAGASCPGHLIEDVLRRFLELRGIALEGTVVP